MAQTMVVAKVFKRLLARASAAANVAMTAALTFRWGLASFDDQGATVMVLASQIDGGSKRTDFICGPGSAASWLLGK